MVDTESPDAAPGPRTEADVDADARALASTVRLRILRLCLDEALTNKEIAARLGRNPGSTLHHVRTLVSRGFLRAEPARAGARGAKEVPYRATGTSVRAQLPVSGIRVLVDTFLEELAEADPARVDIARRGLLVDAGARVELMERIDAVVTEFRARPTAPDAEPWSLFVALHHEPAREGAPAPAAGGAPAPTT